MKTIELEDITTDASRFFRELDLSREEIVCRQDGRARFVIMSADVLEQRRRAMERLFGVIDTVRSRNPRTDSDEILRELEDDETVSDSRG